MYIGMQGTTDGLALRLSVSHKSDARHSYRIGVFLVHSSAYSSRQGAERAYVLARKLYQKLITQVGLARKRRTAQA